MKAYLWNSSLKKFIFKRKESQDLHVKALSIIASLITNCSYLNLVERWESKVDEGPREIDDSWVGIDVEVIWQGGIEDLLVGIGHTHNTVAQNILNNMYMEKD